MQAVCKHSETVTGSENLTAIFWNERTCSVCIYAYCANNPIRFIDPDGRDWKEIEEEDEEGKKRIRYIVTVGVKNSSSKSDKEISKIFNEIKTQFESSFQGKDGNVFYSSTLIRDDSDTDFFFDFLDDVYDNGNRVWGLVDNTGDTKKNRIQIEADDQLINRTGAHELGHTGGLTHPDMMDGIVDANGVFVGDMHQNLMRQTSRGEYPNGYNITTQQLKYIRGVIKNGYSPTPIPSRQIEPRGIPTFKKTPSLLR